MSAYKNTKSAKAEAIVDKIKGIMDELIDVISQDDCLHKFRFDGAVSERAKIVESAKKKCVALSDEHDKMMEQLASVRKGLSQLNLNYQTILEDNKRLEESIQSIKGDDHIDEKEIQYSRLKLKLYKQLTGLYFDLNKSENELTGFAAVKGNVKQHSGFVPFIINTNEPDISITLWDKIREALNNDEKENSQCQTLLEQNKVK